MSPKAIFTRTEYRTVRDGQGVVQSIQGGRIGIGKVQWKVLNLAGGDYFLQWRDSQRRLIIAGKPPYVMWPYPVRPASCRQSAIFAGFRCGCSSRPSNRAAASAAGYANMNARSRAAEPCGSRQRMNQEMQAIKWFCSKKGKEPDE